MNCYSHSQDNYKAIFIFVFIIIIHLFFREFFFYRVDF